MGRKLQFAGTWQPGTNVNSWDTGGKSEFEATQQLVAMQAEVNHLKEQLVTQMENATRERLEATRERREILESFKELAALVSTAGKNQPTSTGQSETNQNANAQNTTLAAKVNAKVNAEIKEEKQEYAQEKNAQTMEYEAKQKEEAAIPVTICLTNWWFFWLAFGLMCLWSTYYIVCLLFRSKWTERNVMYTIPELIITKNSAERRAMPTFTANSSFWLACCGLPWLTSRRFSGWVYAGMIIFGVLPGALLGYRCNWGGGIAHSAYNFVVYDGAYGGRQLYGNGNEGSYSYGVGVDDTIDGDGSYMMGMSSPSRGIDTRDNRWLSACCGALFGLVFVSIASSVLWAFSGMRAQFRLVFQNLTSYLKKMEKEREMGMEATTTFVSPGVSLI